MLFSIFLYFFNFIFDLFLGIIEKFIIIIVILKGFLWIFLKYSDRLHCQPNKLHFDHLRFRLNYNKELYN